MLILDNLILLCFLFIFVNLLSCKGAFILIFFVLVIWGLDEDSFKIDSF